MNFYINNKFVAGYTTFNEATTLLNIFASNSYYLTQNGKRKTLTSTIPCIPIHIHPRIFGGKGGFGSMLRAIGAQIEKTTNREACRDLSGRRLRDINEEQRLKNWIQAQGEREKEAAERKQKKLEKLCVEPKHEFRDAGYEKLREQLIEEVEDAVQQGLKAGVSGARKRKIIEENSELKKKKKFLFDDDLSCSDSNEEDDTSETSSIINKAI